MNKDERDTTEKADEYYREGGRLLARPSLGDEIVISGISGVFPNSRDIYEFRENLFNKVNMVLPNRRWDYNHPEIPVCSGTIPEINKYDGGFFGVHERQSHSMDTLTRIFHEKVMEAIFDAGLHPSELEGTKTGVYVGVCSSENDKTWYFDNLFPQTFAVTGSERSMVAHRISYFLKLRGPSYILDSACSSSFSGLENAYRALRSGEIDNAIVGGTNLCLHPFTTMQFLRLGVLSKDGSCKAFDVQGNGYARSEGFGVIILQKAKCSKRIYTQVVHVKANCDGYKEQGITFPSKDAQTNLLSEFYDECEVDRYSLSFLEAHGTGTKVGDPEECAAIDHVLTSGRKKPLLIGSVKSNIGHSEPASGLCSVIKCILAMETGYIPPNIHFITPKPEIRGLVEGRMKVVVDKIPLQDDNGLMGVNNFGFGGANIHALLRWNPKKKAELKDNLPRLVCVSGRTEEAVTVLLNQTVNNGMDAEYIKLLHEIFRKDILNHLFRGYVIMSKQGKILPSIKLHPGHDKPLYLAFGELDNWYDIGRQLMVLPAFSNSIQRIQKNFLVRGVNILDILLKTKSKTDSISIVGSVAIQLAIVNILNLLDIKPIITFGYFFGELILAYYNETLTLDETINCAFVLNEVTSKAQYNLTTFKEKQIVNGNCIMNGDDIPNGQEKSLDHFKESLKLNKPTELKEILWKNLTNELTLSENGNTDKNIKFIDHLVEAVTRNKYPDIDIKLDSVVLKIGMVPLDSTEDATIISLFGIEESTHLVQFLRGLGKLYMQGYNPQISKLYPQIDFPVSRGTPMISPYIRWKHTREKFVPQYSLDIIRQAKQGIRHYRIQIVDHQWAFVTGHVIDGRNLFPATGYLYLVWETFVIMNGVPLNVSRVSLENCKFIRATSVPTKGSIVLRISIQFGSGNFEVVEGNSLLVTGRIGFLEDSEVEIHDFVPMNVKKSVDLDLNKKDIYKELRLRGYNYSGEFKAIERCTSNASRGYVKWDENWVAFMDNMLQIKVLQIDTRTLLVPTFIAKINIAADSHCDLIKETFKDSEMPQNLSIYNDRHSGKIQCGGITISGLIASPIARKKNLGTPVLETYEFVPNMAELDIQKSVRVNIQILLENTFVYKVQVVELIDEFADKDAEPVTPMIKLALEDEPLVQSVVKILSKKTFSVDVEVEDRNLETQTDCLLVIASRILNRPEILKQAFSVLKENGFVMSREDKGYDFRRNVDPDIEIITVHKTPFETILLLQKQSQLKTPHYIKINSSKDFAWLTDVQVALRRNLKQDLILYSDKEPTNGILGLVNCLRREPDSKGVKCVFIMDEAEEFDPTVSTYSDQFKKNMAINIFKNSQWGTYRHLLLDKSRTIETEHSFVDITIKGDLSSLRWMQGFPKEDHADLEEYLVYVYYASLNFKDIMIATGKIGSEEAMMGRLEQDYKPGFEFSGRDKRGNRVMGSLMKGSLTDILYADPALTFKVPDEWSLEEAATVPVVYTTALYSLIMCGDMKRGDSVLIHSGTGGIGQAAIHLALHCGCKIFTTVGTPAKRDFLKRTYPQLQDENIGNSRDESFEQMVYKGTNGKGVDIVLNSLAEEKLIVSVRCLRRGGRFLEIGKYDMANNNRLSMMLFQKEATFHGITLDMIFYESRKLKYEMGRIFQRLIREGAIKPLNRNIFNYNEVEQAFRFMATGKHMGKVLIQIREPEEKLVCQAPIQKLRCIPRYYCCPQGVYIILGGLGGFGLELTDWLIMRGARKFVLTSRKGISTGYQNYRIRIWKSYGVNVKISTAALDSKEGCKQIIEEGLHMGHIAAIFQLAVVLADSIFENQTSQSFTTSFIPKAFATEYLDDLTRKMCPDLRDFVIFSSVSCGRGNAGQTNYGMANSVMERICEKRKQDGYPALAIEWGAVGEVGLVAEMQEDHTELEISGTLQQRISSCLQVLDDLLTQKEVAILSSMVVAKKRSSQSADNIVEAVINIIGLHDSKCVSLHSTLAELGMDSMTAVEIKQVLERDFEIFLSARDMRTMTLAKLKEIQEEKDGAVQSDERKQSSQFGMEMIFRLLENESSSRIPYVQLTPQVCDESTHPKIIFFPGVEGFAKIFKDLVVHLKNVTALQYILDGQTTSVVKIVESLVPTIEKLLPKNVPFNFVAYSYGSLVALEMVHLLESRGYTGTLICIDGAPLLLKFILKSLNLESERTFQSNLMCHLLSFYIPNEKIAEHKTNIFKCQTWEESLILGMELVKSSAIHEEQYLKIVADTIYKRLKDIGTYKPSYRNLKSNIQLFKPTNCVVQNFVDDYGLSQFFVKPVEIKCFEGNHETILENKKLAEAIVSSF